MSRRVFIKGIQAESGTEINIEDDGTVHIYASKQEGLERAKSMIERNPTNNPKPVSSQGPPAFLLQGGCRVSRQAVLVASRRQASNE